MLLKVKKVIGVGRNLRNVNIHRSSQSLNVYRNNKHSMMISQGFRGLINIHENYEFENIATVCSYFLCTQ